MPAAAAAVFPAADKRTDNMDLTRDIARRMGYLLYIVSPNETSFQRHEDVPDYIVQVSGGCRVKLKVC